ncbi:MAG: VOC family protein [Rivularia sp. (in: cyanobacteria)]
MHVVHIYPRNSNIDTSAVRLGFRVSSVDKVVADLEEIEVVVFSSPRDSQWGRRAVILDPDGYKIELVN